jgi:hypothetical protein
MLHKSKKTERHEEFFRIAIKLLNLKSSSNKPITTDREIGITKPIKELNLSLVICNNHLIRDVKRWIAKKKQKNPIKKVGDLTVENFTKEM